MSTANESRNSSMTSEAYDLLDCFMAGLDDVIYEIAESRAQGKHQVNKEGVIEISQDDVREAAEMVFDAIREAAGKSVSKDAAEQIEKMHRCVLDKCKAQKAGD